LKARDFLGTKNIFNPYFSSNVFPHVVAIVSLLFLKT